MPAPDDILSRLLATGAARPADFQLARDFARLDPLAAANPLGAKLLVTALASALRDGLSFLRLADAPSRLAGAVWSPDDPDPVNLHWAADARDAWTAYALPLAEALSLRPLSTKGAGGPPATVPLPLIAPFFAPGTLAFQRPWLDAATVAARLRDLRDTPPNSLPAPSPAVLDRAMQFAFSLDPAQRQAVVAAATRPFTVVTGGPGTGKTTIVCAILRALLDPDSPAPLLAAQIALCAPTGRAAQRMGEAIRAQCADARGLSPDLGTALRTLRGTTLHTLLGGRAPAFLHTAANPLPHRLVVVDEASMVGVPLMRALLDALAPGTRLVLIGDPRQLPPVDSGAVLGDLVGARKADFVSPLSSSHRFSGTLSAAAAAVDAGDPAPLLAPAAALDGPSWTSALTTATSSLAPSTFHLRTLPADPASAARALRADIAAWASHFGYLSPSGALVAAASSFAMPPIGPDASFPASSASNALFDALSASRILAAVRRGPFGVDDLNARLYDLRRAASNAPAALPPTHLPGVPVLVTANDPARHLFNGDVGIVVLAPDSTPHVLFPRGETVVACPSALLPAHELAYAVTVHKSQGSEYGNVLVVLPASPTCPLLTRRLLYTALTRAKTRAVLLASPPALAAALANDPPHPAALPL